MILALSPRLPATPVVSACVDHIRRKRMIFSYLTPGILFGF